MYKKMQASNATYHDFVKAEKITATCEVVDPNPPTAANAMAKLNDCIGRAGEVNRTFQYTIMKMDSATKLVAHGNKLLMMAIPNLNFRGVTIKEADTKSAYYSTFGKVCPEKLASPACLSACGRPNTFDGSLACQSCVDPLYGFKHAAEKAFFEGEFKHGDPW